MTNTLNSHFTFFDGTTIPRMGFGAMRLTGQPGNFGPYHDWEGGKALLQRAYALGVRHFDTARAYGPGFNERLIRDALSSPTGGYPTDVFIASKGGVEKDANGIRRDTRPETMVRHLDESLANLGIDRIDLYYVHAPDRATPIRESVAALEEARIAGKIKRIGLSNVSRQELEAAMEVAPISAVQNRYSPADRADPEQEAMVDWLDANGIAFVPHGPLGANPMQRGAKVNPGLALSRLLERAPNVLLIPGTTNQAHLHANIAASAGEAVLEAVNA